MFVRAQREVGFRLTLSSETWNPHPSIRQVGGSLRFLCNSMFLLGSCKPWEHWTHYPDPVWVRGFSESEEIQQTHIEEGLGMNEKMREKK